jgi:hypothetical protein
MKAPVDRSIPPTVTERDGWSVAGAVLLVCVAFGGSYTHVVATVERVSAPGVLAYVIAAMPELSVALATRGLLIGARGFWVWANLATAGAFTLTANLGLGHWAVVAAWPAWSAVAALGLLGAHGRKAAPVAPVVAPAAPRPRKATPMVAGATRPTVAPDGPVVAEANVATTRAAWEASDRTMTDEAIAAALGISKAAARSRRRGWDGSKKTPARAIEGALP